MVNVRFLFDFGERSTETITLERPIGYTMRDLVVELKNSDEWFLVGNKAIQISKIKSITKLY